MHGFICYRPKGPLTSDGRFPVFKRAGRVIVAAALAVAGIGTSWTAHADPKKDDRPTCVANATPAGATGNARRAVTSDHKGEVIRWIVGPPPGSPYHYQKHGSKAAFVSVSLGGGNLRVFAAGYDGKVIVSNLDQDPARPRPFGTFVGHVPPGAGELDTPEVWVVVPSADGTRALSATNEGEILHWNVTQFPSRRSRYKASEEWVAGLAFRPMTSDFVSSHADGKVLVWTINDTDPSATQTMPMRTLVTGNDRPVNSVAVTRDGRFVVAGGFDNVIRIWDLNATTDRATTEITKHTDWVWRVALSPGSATDPQVIATASEDGTVRLFGLNGKPYRHKTTHADAIKTVGDGVMGVAFIDNQTVVYTTDDSGGRSLDVWDVTDFEPQ